MSEVLELQEHYFTVDGRRHKIRFLEFQKELPFLVEVNGKKTQVELSKEFCFGSSFKLKIGDKLHKVKLNKVNRSTQFSIRIDDRTYVVKNETLKAVPTQTFNTSLQPLERKVSRKTVSEKGVITAPMPGRIALLRVKVGDSVGIGEPLCVLEAMKMENEITASCAGNVKEVLVSEGAGVSSGDRLFIIE